MIKIAQGIFFACLLFFFSQLTDYHAHVITSPFPLEYREGTFLASTQLLLKGGNPFDLSNQPQYTNVYGIFYNLIVFPFAKLFGPTLIVHRSVTAFFIFLSCLLIFAVTSSRKIHPVYCFAASLLFYAELIFFVTPLARPDSLGLFLMLAGIGLPFFKNYSFKSIVGGLMLSLLALYTKPYFVIGGIYLLVYTFLFVSKPRATAALIIFLAALSLSLICIHGVFPCYINNVFLTHVTNSGIYQVPAFYSHIQFQKYFYHHKGLLLIVGLLLFSSLRKRRFSDWLKSFRSIKPDIFTFCLFCSFFLVYFIFSRNSGQWMYYFFHLISPFFIICAFGFFTAKSLWPLIIIPFLILDLYSLSYECLPMKEKSHLYGEASSWRYLYRLVINNKRILAGPILTPALIENHKPFYDSGQSDAFLQTSHRPVLKNIFPQPALIVEKQKHYIDELTQKIKNKEFDAVILTNYPDGLSQISREILSQNYELKTEVGIQMLHSWQGWLLDVWFPKR